MEGQASAALGRGWARQEPEALTASWPRGSPALLPRLARPPRAEVSMGRGDAVGLSQQDPADSRLRASPAPLVGTRLPAL